VTSIELRNSALRPSADRGGWQTLRFCLFFSPHLLAAPVVLVLGVTFMHELAHAAAALAVGGAVTDFALLPGQGYLGHVRWDPPPGAGWVEDGLVSLAPYLMWSTMAALVCATAAFPNRLHWMVAASLYLYGYVVPIGDIAWNLYVAGTSDLVVPGPEGLFAQAVGSLLLVGAYVVGFWVQRRLFGDRAVGMLGYLVATVTLGVAFGIVCAVGLAVVTAAA
jgi:hypothetical protein